MKYTDIEAFQAIVFYGTISRAAEMLFISQSALSSRIHSLEEELGITLFSRGKGKRAAELTDEGRTFAAIADKLETLWRESLSISTRGHEIQMRIASISNINSIYISKVCGTMLLKYPTMSLHAEAWHSSACYEHITNMVYDMAFINNYRYSREVRSIPVFREPMVFVCGKDSNYGDMINVRELDIQNEILLDWGPDFWLWRKNIFDKNVTARVFIDDISTLENALLADRNYWSVATVATAKELEKRGNIRICTMNAPPPDRTIYALIHENNNSRRENELFLKELMKIVGEYKGNRIVYEEGGK